MTDSPRDCRRPTSTKDAALPGAFEGETVSRRRFMSRTASGAGAVAAAAFTLPALGFAIGPVFDRQSASWQEIGPLSRFTESDYTPTVITIEPGIGEAGRSIAYVRRHNRAIDGPIKDRYDRVIAISSRCVHVGCPVRWVAASRKLHLPVPRRRVRLPRAPDRRPPATPPGSVLHGDPSRAGVRRPAVQRQQRAPALRATRSGRATRRDRAVPVPGPVLNPAGTPRGQALTIRIAAEAPASGRRAQRQRPISTTRCRGYLLRCVVDRGWADLATPQSPFSTDWRTVRMRHTCALVETAMGPSVVGTADDIDLVRLTECRL